MLTAQWGTSKFWRHKDEETMLSSKFQVLKKEKRRKKERKKRISFTLPFREEWKLARGPLTFSGILEMILRRLFSEKQIDRQTDRETERQISKQILWWSYIIRVCSVTWFLSKFAAGAGKPVLFFNNIHCVVTLPLPFVEQQVTFEILSQS